MRNIFCLIKSSTEDYSLKVSGANQLFFSLIHTKVHQGFSVVKIAPLSTHTQQSGYSKSV